VPATPSVYEAQGKSLLGMQIEAWAAGVIGALRWSERILDRGDTPLDVAVDTANFVRVVTDRRPPEWASPNQIVFADAVARLRDFSVRGAERVVVPTLVLPPQAGHDSCIVDYSRNQSQMRTIIGAGLTSAFSLDWRGATTATRNTSVEDYLALIERAIERIAGRSGLVNLVGDCQGGWLATIYAALRPERINTLTIAGAPIDFHAGEPIIHETLQSLAPSGDLGVYEALVALGGGVLKGEHMLAGFISINPGGEARSLWDLLAHIREDAHVARYREFEDWFKHTQDIPGAFYLWIVQHLFRDNELVRGELMIDGQRVDLSRIKAPVNLLAGTADHITPPDQVFALGEAVSTPQELIYRDVTQGGHLGLFMGHEALSKHWPPLLERVKACS
jgi:poly(3-hydroxybutyrate) depolymerase